jgi:hypothetical protein
MVAFVTDAELSALLGGGADAARITKATAAANDLLAVWIEPYDPLNPPTVATAAQAQAGLELAHTLYRRHAAVGGIFSMDEVVARLPADLTKGIRDLLDAHTHWFGVA